MTFTQKLAAAGFVKPDGSVDKAAFAAHIDYSLRQIQRWKDSPPKWALLLIDGMIERVEDGLNINLNHEEFHTKVVNGKD